MFKIIEYYEQIYRRLKPDVLHSITCSFLGLISVYDKENFNQHLNAQLPFRPHLKKTLYSPTRHDYTQQTYNPWEDCEGKVGKCKYIRQKPQHHTNKKS